MSGSALGSWAHLAGRLVDVVFARPLTPAEMAWLSARLDLSELDLFLSQGVPDRRHGYTAGRHVEAAAPERADLIRAAVLHDVGKRHARLGVIGRVLASLALRLRIPVRGRYALYRDHGALGASDLARIGSPSVVVEYADTHHGGSAGGSLSTAERRILDASDRTGIRLGRRRAV